MAQGRLTDVVVFSCDGNGSWAPPNIWHTRPNGNYEIFLQNSLGTFLNGPTSSNVQPNISLTAGVNTLRFFASPGVDSPEIGISLFFDGSSTPSISAFAALLLTGQEPHNIFPDNSQTTPKPFPGVNTGYIFPGAGTLSFDSGNQHITLTDFFLATPSVYNLDQVGQYSTGPDGFPDYVGGITLSVTPVPEPTSALWGLGFIAALVTLRRRGLTSPRC